MALNTDQARGNSRISNRITYRPIKNVPSPTQEANKRRKDRNPSSSNRIKCQSGYVLMNGRCLPQEERNSKNDATKRSRNNTINKSNKRFYST
jgi:hypothetical protein